MSDVERRNDSLGTPDAVKASAIPGTGGGHSPESEADLDAHIEQTVEHVIRAASPEEVQALGLSELPPAQEQAIVDDMRHKPPVVLGTADACGPG